MSGAPPPIPSNLPQYIITCCPACDEALADSSASTDVALATLSCGHSVCPTCGDALTLVPSPVCPVCKECIVGDIIPNNALAAALRELIAFDCTGWLDEAFPVSAVLFEGDVEAISAHLACSDTYSLGGDTVSPDYAGEPDDQASVIRSAALAYFAQHARVTTAITTLSSRLLACIDVPLSDINVPDTLRNFITKIAIVMTKELAGYADVALVSGSQLLALSRVDPVHDVLSPSIMRLCESAEDQSELWHNALLQWSLIVSAVEFAVKSSTNVSIPRSVPALDAKVRYHLVFSRVCSRFHPSTVAPPRCLLHLRPASYDWKSTHNASPCPRLTTPNGS